jgi:hypothetical protein
MEVGKVRSEYEKVTKEYEESKLNDFLYFSWLMACFLITSTQRIEENFRNEEQTGRVVPTTS